MYAQIPTQYFSFQSFDFVGLGKLAGRPVSLKSRSRVSYRVLRHHMISLTLRDATLLQGTLACHRILMKEWKKATE